MRANRRKFLAPFLLIASLAVALGSLFAPASRTPAARSPAARPARNWDVVTGICH